MTIDKTKGIIAKPMPRCWHDRMALHRPDSDDPEELARWELNCRIVADKKPYFMRYIYPQLMRDYNNYINTANEKALSEHRLSIDEMLAMPPEELTEEQRTCLRYYQAKMPVGNHDCVMNRICRKVEAVFGNGIAEPDEPFDYTVMRSNIGYSSYTYYAVERLFKQYLQKLKRFAMDKNNIISTQDDPVDYRASLLAFFVREVALVCNNSFQMADIILDMVYRRNGTKQFAWDMVSHEIIYNLLMSHGGKLSFPRADPDGDIEFMGERYSMTQMEVDADGYYSE